jgi:hypothetical protein
MEDKKNYKGCPFDEPIDYSFKKEPIEMDDKDKAMALVQEYKVGLKGFMLSQYEAIQCAKLDLQHSIELLESIKHKSINEGFEASFICLELASLKNQLEHLNSI